MRTLLLTLLLFLAMTVAAFAGVNINTANFKELNSLPGIGPAKAANIIEYRSEHGSFKTVDDLQKVKGIGIKTMEKLRNQIVLEDK